MFLRSFTPYLHAAIFIVDYVIAFGVIDHALTVRRLNVSS
jgi:hypothetical protein